MSNALMIINPQAALEAAKVRKDVVVSMRSSQVLQAGVDYGVIPGSPKPSLLKPGAERLCAAFGFNPVFETLTAVERWDGEEPLFFYRIRCHLIHIDSSLEVATGIGSCNSRESKYRWRWAREEDIPEWLDKSTLKTRANTISEFAFAVDKAETTGKYGKPAAYWQQFKDAIANGTARKVKRTTARGESEAWEIGGIEYRIPNDDIFSLVNTIEKMACKRALIAATLIAANASEFFTQDIEDMPGFGVDMSPDDAPRDEVIIENPKPAPEPQPQPQPPPRSAYAPRQQDVQTGVTAEGETAIVVSAAPKGNGANRHLVLKTTDGQIIRAWTRQPFRDGGYEEAEMWSKEGTVYKIDPPALIHYVTKEKGGNQWREMIATIRAGKTAVGEHVPSDLAAVEL